MARPAWKRRKRRSQPKEEAGGRVTISVFLPRSPLLGAAHPDRGPQGLPPNTSLRILSLNVTSLTMAQLSAVLAHAEACSAHVVCLQETRHYGPAAWACRAADKAGWRSKFSVPSPPSSLAVARARVAVLCRPTLAKCSGVSFLGTSNTRRS